MTPQEWNEYVEKEAQKYCPDRIVDLPNGEKLNVIHSKKTGFKDGVEFVLRNIHLVPKLEMTNRTHYNKIMQLMKEDEIRKGDENES